MPNVRGPSRDHSSVVGSKRDGQPRAAAHRRPEAQRQPQAEQRRRRPAAPNSSLASQNAIRGATANPCDTTTRLPASGSTSSRKTLQLQPRTWQPADVRRSSAWQLLLPDPAARPTHAHRVRDSPDLGAPDQGGSETGANEHNRQSATRTFHQRFRYSCGVVCRVAVARGSAQPGGAMGKCNHGRGSSTHHPGPRGRNQR
jgi:hypothetical protein